MVRRVVHHFFFGKFFSLCILIAEKLNVGFVVALSLRSIKFVLQITSDGCDMSIVKQLSAASLNEQQSRFPFERWAVLVSEKRGDRLDGVILIVARNRPKIAMCHDRYQKAVVICVVHL